MLIKPNIIKVRRDDGTFSELQNLMVGEQNIVPAEKVDGLSKVAISGHYKDLEGAPDPKDLIVDAGIEVGNEEPERTSIDVWIDTNQGQTTYRIPEVKDNLINEQDTWSSARISEGDLGINSSIAQMPYSTSWSSVAYGNGVYVAVQNKNSTNEIVYSKDGITWKYSLIKTSASYNKIIYADNKFVAVGYSTSLYSEDGITWISSSMPKKISWTGLTYGNGMFVAVGHNSVNTDGGIAYSEDGITWNLSDYYAVLDDITYDTYGRRFVATGCTGKKYYSGDGITFTEVDIGNSHGSIIASGNGKYIALPNYNGYVGWYSEDGVTWIETNDFGGDFISFISITYGGNKFIATASDGRAFYSHDGIGWYTLIFDEKYEAVTYDGEKFIAIAMDSTNVIFSKNGIHWDTKSPCLSQNEENVTSQVHEALNINTNYCLGETKTGDTWIDGKPIYRFIWQGTTSLKKAQGVLCRLPEGHFDTVFSLRGVFKRTTDNNWFAIPNGYYGGTDWTVNLRTDIATDKPDGILVGFGEEYTDSNRPIIIFAEYTKQ